MGRGGPCWKQRLVLRELLVMIRFLLMIACASSIVVGAVLGGSCQRKSERSDQGDKESRAPGPGAAGNAPQQSAEELKAPLAKIDNITITLGELQERINRQSPYIRARYTSLEQKKEFLDSLIRFEILAKEAYRRGLDKDPEVVRTMKQVMIQKLVREELDAKITADSVPEQDMKTYYDANLSEYVKPEEVRVSAIILRNKAQAERVAAEARGDAGKTNKSFRDLVMKYTSDEDTKLRGGDLRYFDETTKELPAEVVKAAFALVNTGDVSGAVAAGNGTWYVLKQTGRRKAATKSFEDAKPAIRNKLFRERRLAAQKELIERLRQGAKIEINEPNLAKVRIDTSNAVDEGRGSDLTPAPLGDPTFPPGPPAAASGSGAGSSGGIP